MTDRQLLRFLIVAAGAGFLIEGLAIAVGLTGTGRPLLLAVMWTPALAALVSSRESRSLAVVALKRFRLWHVPLGLAIGATIPGVHELVLWLGGGGTWSSRFPLADDGRGVVGAHHVALILGNGPQPFSVLALNLVISISAGATLAGVVSGLGEELGWRAVLQPEATRRLGALRGTVAVGLVWAYWHLPVNLAGYNDEVHPVLTALVLFPVGVVAGALALGWLWRRTGSVWPVALAHGMYNTASGGLVLEPRSWAADNLANLLAAAIVGAVFAALLRRRARPSPPVHAAHDARGAANARPGGWRASTSASPDTPM